MWLKYSDAPIDLNAFVDRHQGERIGKYEKPRGCWITDDSEDCWRSWCEGQRFGLEELTHKHEVTLDETNILILKKEREVEEFAAKFSAAAPWSWQGRHYVDRGINWPAVAAQHDGIIITPYQWGLRMADGFDWYYGWDCASGCIWKASAIREIRLIKIDSEIAKPKQDAA